jgi:hypothetical protein
MPFVRRALWKKFDLQLGNLILILQINQHIDQCMRDPTAAE